MEKQIIAEQEYDMDYHYSVSDLRAMVDTDIDFTGKYVSPRNISILEKAGIDMSRLMGISNTNDLNDYLPENECKSTDGAFPFLDGFFINPKNRLMFKSFHKIMESEEEIEKSEYNKTISHFEVGYDKSNAVPITTIIETINALTEDEIQSITDDSMIADFLKIACKHKDMINDNIRNSLIDRCIDMVDNMESYLLKPRVIQEIDSYLNPDPNVIDDSAICFFTKENIAIQLNKKTEILDKYFEYLLCHKNTCIIALALAHTEEQIIKICEKLESGTLKEPDYQYEFNPIIASYDFTSIELFKRVIRNIINNTGETKGLNMLFNCNLISNGIDTELIELFKVFITPSNVSWYIDQCGCGKYIDEVLSTSLKNSLLLLKSRDREVRLKNIHSAIVSTTTRFATLRYIRNVLLNEKIDNRYEIVQAIESVVDLNNPELCVDIMLYLMEFLSFEVCLATILVLLTNGQLKDQVGRKAGELIANLTVHPDVKSLEQARKINDILMSLHR